MSTPPTSSPPPPLSSSNSATPPPPLSVHAPPHPYTPSPSPPPRSLSPPPPLSSSNSLSGGLIAGIAAGTVIVVALLLGFVFFLYNRKRNRPRYPYDPFYSSPSPSGATHFSIIRNITFKTIIFTIGRLYKISCIWLTFLATGSCITTFNPCFHIETRSDGDSS